MKLAKCLTYILAITAFALLFFSPFGPISDKLVPYPIGWAGIFTYFAMILSFNRKYEESKDVFWFIVAAGFFPLFISDLYFFPIPKFLGLGMLEWAAVQGIVFPLGFAYYTQNKTLKYSNLVLLTLSPLTAAAFIHEENWLLSPFKVLSILYLVIIAISLLYYAYKQKSCFFMIGTILNFLIASTIVLIYFITGTIIFGWEHLFMATITDRIAIFGRILMALNDHSVDAKIQTSESKPTRLSKCSFSHR